MSTYAIGDVQGCYDELLDLLSLIEFNPKKDTLWFVGDLINRGPKSLEVLRFVKNLGKSAVCVLGNHDLHYLCVATNCEPLAKKDTIHELLKAEDGDELFQWVRTWPLVYHDKTLGFTMAHAGLAPQWTLTDALDCSREVETMLQSDEYRNFLLQLYGNTPNCWDKSLQGFERLRVIVNYCTRMRYVYKNGALNLTYKGPLGGQPEGCYPWFTVPTRVNKELKILYGHWASLQGKADTHNIYALDTGCCWGNALTAFRLDDEQYFKIDCHTQRGVRP